MRITTIIIVKSDQIKYNRIMVMLKSVMKKVKYTSVAFLIFMFVSLLVSVNIFLFPWGDEFTTTGGGLIGGMFFYSSAISILFIIHMNERHLHRIGEKRNWGTQDIVYVAKTIFIELVLFVLMALSLMFISYGDEVAVRWGGLLVSMIIYGCFWYVGTGVLLYQVGQELKEDGDDLSHYAMKEDTPVF